MMKAIEEIPKSAGFGLLNLKRCLNMIMQKECWMLILHWVKEWGLLQQHPLWQIGKKTEHSIECNCAQYWLQWSHQQVWTLTDGETLSKTLFGKRLNSFFCICRERSQRTPQIFWEILLLGFNWVPFCSQKQWILFKCLNFHGMHWMYVHQCL